MACIAPDGTLTVQARAVLAAFAQPHTPEDVATTIDLPLFRIRSSLRELVEAGLLEAAGAQFQTTDAGRLRLAAPAS